MLWLMILGGLPKVSPIQRGLFFSPDPNAGIYVRHGPESQTVFIAFSCAFLIKVRRGVACRVDPYVTNGLVSCCNQNMHHTYHQSSAPRSSGL
jgi:hypothetical protein